MIEVENLTKHYGDFAAVDDISFRVDRGEIVGFLGLNGAGKTTTMRMLTCFMPATAGKARVANFDVFTQSLDVRRHIGYLPERPPLYMDMTVRSYLEYVATLSGLRGASREDRIDEVEDRCGLGDVDGRLIAHLSKGYRQRVGLAQALVHNPDVLIMDEPTSALDPAQRFEIRQLIRELAQEHTILLSTHILPEVENVCKRVIIINEGRIVARERIDELSSTVARAETIYVEAYEPPENFIALVNALDGVDTVTAHDRGFLVETALGKDIRRDLANFIHQKGWGLRELKAMKLTLEDIFLKLVSQDRQERLDAAADAADENDSSETRDDGSREASDDDSNDATADASEEEVDQ